MKQRFILFRRAGVFYCEETATGKQTSLRTKDEGEAITLLNTKNEATRQPAMNLQIAQVYLQHADPTLAQRTWQNVMDAMLPLKTGPTQARWASATRSMALAAAASLALDAGLLRRSFFLATFVGGAFVPKTSTVSPRFLRCASLYFNVH